MEDKTLYSRCFKDRDPYFFQLDGETEDDNEFGTLFRLLEYFEKFAYRKAGRFFICCPRKGIFRLGVSVSDFYLFSDEDHVFFSVVNAVCNPMQFTVHSKTNNVVMLADYYVPGYELIDLFAEDFEAYDPQNWEDLKKVLIELLQKNKKGKKRCRGYKKLH